MSAEHEPRVDRRDDGLQPEVPADDRIIGQAFRASLAVLGLAGAAALLGWWLLGGEDEGPAAEEAAVAAPRAALAEARPPQVRFVDVTRAAGIEFERCDGAAGEKLLPETMGGGVAFLDFDLDGDADLLFVNGAPWERADGDPTQALYACDGRGRFEDVTAAAGLDFTLQGTGVAVGDYDGDGDPDVYLAGVGEERLLRNDGGRFVDVTRAAGIATDPERWSTSAAFFDPDRDGDLDLFVCSYVRWSPEIDRAVDYRLTGIGRAYGPPMNYPGDHSRFFRNRGDGTFEEVAAEVGLTVTNEATGVPAGKALGVLPCDVDGDGWLDVVVANDTVANFCFRNRGDGTFEEIGARAGLAFDRNGKATGAMGIDAAELRGDGRLAVAIGNFANEMSSLYVAQAGRALYTDESIVEGLGAPSRRYLSFGVVFLDYDLDGREDLLQVNGHLESEIATVQPSQTYEQPAQLFWNAGPDARAALVEVPAAEAGDLLARPLVGRACAYADIDADGDLDLVLTQSRGAPLLVRNDQALGGHWLRVRLEGRGANRAGIGALVELVGAGRTQRRRVMPARGYLAQVRPLAHFGLGAAASADDIRVVWPDGSEQVVPCPGVDREVVVVQPR